MADTGLSDKFITGHLLRIVAASVHANFSATGATSTGFVVLWTCGARWDYINAYKGALEKSESCDSNRDGRGAGRTSRTNKHLCSGKCARQRLIACFTA